MVLLLIRASHGGVLRVGLPQVPPWGIIAADSQYRFPMAWTPRSLHRSLVPLAAVPLVLTALTGSAYGAIESRGVEAPHWLMDLHQGEFGPLNLEPYYSVLLAVCTLVLVGSGVAMFMRTARKNPS